MTDTKQKTVRVLCAVPLQVKRTVQERRRPDLSENDQFVKMLTHGLADFWEMPAVTTENIFRIDAKNKEHFAAVGIKMPESMHRELMEASKQVPQYPITGHEPVNYRFIDLVACLLTRGLFG